MAVDARGGVTVHKIGWRDRFDAALDHHRLSARDAATRLAGNWVTSVLTVLVIAVALSLPGVLYVALDNVKALAGKVDGQARISLFLKMDVDEHAQQALAKNLSARPDVSRVTVITREQALEEFRRQSGYADVLANIDGNPLPGVIEIEPATVSAAPDLRDELAKEPAVDIAQLDTAWLQKLVALLAFGERMAQALVAAFAMAVLLVVVNTIRLAIESRRDEILVVKLFGGTDAFVRRPFLYSGAWFGLGGGLVAAALVWALVWWVSVPVATLVSLYGSTFRLAGLGVADGLGLVLTGTFLGWIGAWIAVARHLRAVEPT